MSREWQVVGLCGQQLAAGGREAVIAMLAEAQHGVVASHQLQALGLSATAVSRRASRGLLHRVCRGVYAVGHPRLSPHERWMAAVLACGQQAALSHRSAAALWELLPAIDRIDVTTPTGAGRTSDVIAAHRSSLEGEATVVDGIPVTTVARTLLDLAGTVPARTLERAIAEAEVRRLDAGPLRAHLQARRGRPGTARLRAVLDDRADPAITRSELEERVLALCKRERIPRPAVNASVALPDGPPVELDFLWRARRLVLEADGRAVHATPGAFERDRRRDQRLLVAGYVVLHTTWQQVAQRAAELAGALREMLAAPPAPRDGAHA